MNFSASSKPKNPNVDSAKRIALGFPWPDFHPAEKSLNLAVYRREGKTKGKTTKEEKKEEGTKNKKQKTSHQSRSVLKMKPTRCKELKRRKNTFMIGTIPREPSSTRVFHCGSNRNSPLPFEVASLSLSLSLVAFAVPRPTSSAIRASSQFSFQWGKS